MVYLSLPAYEIFYTVGYLFYSAKQFYPLFTEEREFSLIIFKLIIKGDFKSQLSVVGDDYSDHIGEVIAVLSSKGFYCFYLLIRHNMWGNVPLELNG